MGDRHSSDGSNPAADDDMQADGLLFDALACTDAEREAGRLPAELRARALELFAESLSEGAAALDDPLLDDLLPEALELEAASVETDGSLPEALRHAALAAAADAGYDDLLEEAFGIEAAGEATAALRPSARHAAFAAWDAEAKTAAEATPVLAFPGAATRSDRVRPARSEPLRARRMRTPFFLRPVAAAAILLVALGAGLFLFGGPDEAEAGLQLRALSRRDLSSTVGMSQVEPGYFAAVSNRSILIRLQNNIKLRLLREERQEEALGVLEAMLMIAPAQAALWHEAGQLNAELGNLRAAIISLEHFLDLGRDPSALSQTREALRKLKTRLN